MKKFCGFLHASATMDDSKLEPNDETTYHVTITNTSKLFTAENVMATISVAGGAVDGLKVTPDDRFFGTISPGKSVVKEISILTERVEPGDYQLCYHLDFNATAKRCEGEHTHFVVKPD